MNILWQDLRYGARALYKNPVFTLIAALTLALGIGANTAIFSVVNTLLFRPLPFHEPERLVWIANTGTAGGLSSVTTRVANFNDWRAQNKSFEDLAAYFAFFDYGSYNLVGVGEPERLVGVDVSQNFFALLGVRPLLGRGFNEEECRWNGSPAVILSHAYWTRRFAADPGVIGRSLTLNDKPTTVVGVMPPDFDFASVFSPGSKIDILTPFPLTQETDRWGNTLAVVGRLKPGATIAQAQAEFDLLNRQLKQAHPERWSWGAKMSGLQEQISGRFRRAFLALFGAVGCVLLIACANLSNLLLARASTRRKEMAVRLALGANRARLTRQMLTESLLLSCAGAMLGLPLAYGATRALATSKAFSIPLLQSVTIDWTTLSFTLIVAFAAGLLFGAAPALQMSGADMLEDLKDAGRGSSHGMRAWTRQGLVVSEVALACVLLVGAGLLVRSFKRLLEVDLGFRPEQAAAWRIETGERFQNDAQRVAFFNELILSVMTVPGVESAGLTDTLPLGRNRSWGVGAKGQTYAEGQYPIAFPRIIDHGYLKTMRIPMRAGRDFNEHDTAESEKALIINETMARRLWPDRDAVGQIAMVGGREWRIVGVAGNVRHSSLEQEAGLEMYLPITQSSSSSVELVVRTKLAPEAMAPGVRAALSKVDPRLPTAEFQTLGQLVDQATSPKRLVTLLLGGFSLLALILAALGIYGVISYSVTQRTRELGIRVALGAQTAKVLMMVIRQGLAPVAIGLALGLAGAAALTRLMATLLFGISATDPATFAGIALLLVSVALLACYFPARRAAKVDPMIALRRE
ncbi:MAG TPA: ABC transporter permease [Blastocatellia bacterium]|nr:ABC transporter permease [Blastocatellia bacterium]